MISRRTALYLFAGAPLLAAGAAGAVREPVIPRLMSASRAYSTVSERIDFISRKLLGVRYQAHTLIGGPHKKEQFVLRDDAFDCVTYCEAVLAAAIAKDFADYPKVLQRIRYAKDEIRWAERNHDFAQWNRNAVEKKICRPVIITPGATVEKALSGGELGKRRYSFAAVPTRVMLANPKALQAGDVIGFVSRRPDLDFFHTGFIAFGKRGTLMLRHASQSHGRVVDENMMSFAATTGVQYVTLLRAEEPAPRAYAAAALPLGCTSAV